MFYENKKFEAVNSNRSFFLRSIPIMRYTLTFLLLVLFADSSFAGMAYEVTSRQGTKTVKYMVNFGGGRMMDQWTAFDPVSKKFVYFGWSRDQSTPLKVGSIWDHESGVTRDLYKFPNVPHPLTVIPSISAMKVCPVTGDRKFTIRPVLAYD